MTKYYMQKKKWTFTMNLSLSLKTLFRSPVRTILTFVLLAVVSFAFFMRVGEYTITRREINKAAKQYRGVSAAEARPVGDIKRIEWSGTPLIAYTYFLEADSRISIDYPDPIMAEYHDTLYYQKITSEQISAIAALLLISHADRRYMTAGVSDDYYRLDESGSFYDYTARCVIETTLMEVTPGPEPDGVGRMNRLNLDGYEILAGNKQQIADLIVGDGDFAVNALSYKFTAHSYFGYTSQARMQSRLTPNYVYDTEYMDGLTPGHRYVIVMRYEPKLSVWRPRPSLPLSWVRFDFSDFISNPWCEPIQSVEGEPENYLELEKFSALRELVEITNSDVRTFDVVYTEDLRSIMRFAENDMMIFDGRALTREDSEAGSQVCVISREVAREYGLSVGDTMTLSLGTELFEQIKGLGALAVTRERYSPPVKEVTLEIVGIYADTDSSQRQANRPHWSYSINTVFVPKSLLPIDESTLSNHEFSPSEVSFVIDNAWDIPAFLEEAGPLFESLGLRLLFNDGGWPAIADNFKQVQRLSMINIAVFSAAMAMAMGFTVYLFIVRKKKEYAIMRALGTPKRRSALSLVMPLMAVSAVSVVAGSCVAWIYSVQTIENNNALQALEGYAINASMPALVIIGCILGELLLAALLASAMLWRLGTMQPLALLQGGKGKA